MAENPREVKHVLITGATGGIGKAIAERLVREGKNVYVTGRDLQKLNVLVAALNGMKKNEDQTIRSFCFDIGHLTAVKRVLPALCKLPLDTVIFNAGVIFPDRRAAAEDDFPEMEDTIKVNLLGHWLISFRMRKTDHLKDSVRFVCLSSSMAPMATRSGKRLPSDYTQYDDFFSRQFFSDGWLSYIDSKHGMIVLAEWLQKDLNDTQNNDKKAVAIHPGMSPDTQIMRKSFLNSQFFRSLLSPLSYFLRIDSPEVCADRVIDQAVLVSDDELPGRGNWICEGVKPIPVLTDNQRMAFVGWAQDAVTNYS